jgi:hypothetical protein
MGKMLANDIKIPNKMFIGSDSKGNARHWKGNNTKKFDKKFANHDYDKER